MTNEGCCQLWVLHLPWPRALLALSLLAGLRKPPLQGSRHWSPGIWKGSEQGRKGEAEQRVSWQKLHEGGGDAHRE